jgi:hypothetical protein
MKSILQLVVLAIVGLSLSNCTSCPFSKKDSCATGGSCCSAPAKCPHGMAKSDCAKCKGM